jgi:hypothetical protein
MRGKPGPVKRFMMASLLCLGGGGPWYMSSTSAESALVSVE